MKLKNQFHHNSIDETSLNDSQNNENEEDNIVEENNRRLINSDMQLNNQNINLNHSKLSHLSKYQEMPNQKRVTGKLMNMRQSPRFSPAASSSPSNVPVNLQSTLISKSQTSLNSNGIPASLSQTNNLSNNFDQSQLHHHHHHHHHFHHHFHNSNNEIESQQQLQNPAINMVDSTQSVFLRFVKSNIDTV